MNNVKEFSETEFADPGKKYRPMPVIHADETSVNGVNRQTLNLLNEYGYGGVVTNVSFNMYLESEEMWESLTENVKYAIDTLGMRVWLYDELHYPSGAAGGLVLRENPEWQARGLVNDYTLVQKGQALYKEAKHGHELILAKAFKGTGIENIDLDTETDILSFADAEGNLAWTAPASGSHFVITQYAKNFYEGTHAVNNWAVLRRAISVLREEPVKKFIEVTHEGYKKRLGEYFGGAIEAFFTDEPAMIGTYFPKPPTTPGVLDPIDPLIPLEKTVNYIDGIWEIFSEKYGYDLASYSHYLFGGGSELARQVRWDYYRLLAELMENSYSKQLGDWCGENNVASSGHWLLEENIFTHPIFNGNLLRNMSHQQIPGIDLLTSYPNVAVNWAATAAKFASSAAHMNGGYKAFSEISAAFDSRQADVYSVIGAAGVQVAMGINQFACFYRHYEWSAAENRQFTDSLGRMSYLVDGGAHVAHVALYYPIESIYGDTFPPMDVNDTASGYGEKAVSVSGNFTNLCRQLVGNQIDFDILDSQALSECEIADGYIATPYGEKFSVLLIPETRALERRTVELLIKAKEKGVKLVMQNTDGILSPSAADKQFFAQSIESIKDYKNLEILKSVSKLTERLSELGLQAAVSKEAGAELLATHFKFKDKSLYMFVNTGGTQKSYNMTVNSVGRDYRLWNIYTGAAEGVNVGIDGEKTSFSLTIPAGRVQFLTIEQ